MMMKNIVLLLSFVSSLLFAKDLTPVTLQLKWKHQFQFAGYYAALHKGYYKEVGLDVTIKEASIGINMAEEILNKKAHFGVGTSSLLLEYAQGKPLVVLGVIFQHSPLALMTLQENVQTIHDLANKTLMIEDGSADIYALLKRENIDIKSLNITEHTFNPKKLIDKEVDAMSVYSIDEPYYLQSEKIRYNLFSPREAGIDFYGDNLFTLKELVEKDPKLVEAFKSASLKGWQYALSHHAEIIELILNTYNTQNKPKEYLEFEAKNMMELIYPDILEIGYMHKGRWKHIASVYQELGFLNHKNIDLDMFLYEHNENFFEKYQIFLYGVGVLIAVLFLSWYFIYSLNKKVKIETAKNIEQLQKIAMSNMVANISHQWKEPLLQISVLNHIVLHKISRTQEALQKEDIVVQLYEIDKTIAFMSETMDNFLNFYKEEHKEEKLDLKTTIVQAIQLLENRIQNAHLKSAINATTCFEVIGNKNQIMQVWLNFINNTLNAIEKNRIKDPYLQITLQEKKIVFEDNCGGIKNIEAVFTQENSGLGLKMCKEILQKHGFGLQLSNTAYGLKIETSYKG
jgi:ABC-type nitrate/sulfonate/bicarbonate transport system substrate-binding protein